MVLHQEHPHGEPVQAEVKKCAEFNFDCHNKNDLSIYSHKVTKGLPKEVAAIIAPAQYVCLFCFVQLNLIYCFVVSTPPPAKPDTLVGTKNSSVKNSFLCIFVPPHLFESLYDSCGATCERFIRRCRSSTHFVAQRDEALLRNKTKYYYYYIFQIDSRTDVINSIFV